MHNVKIYLTDSCPYCVRAKRFFNDHQIPYTEVNLTHNHEELMRLKIELNWQTVPMIFIGDHFVGGFTDLMEMSRSGELKKLLPNL